MSKNVVLFTNITLSMKPCLDAQLEILFKHFFLGDQVTVVVWNSEQLKELLSNRRFSDRFIQERVYNEFVQYIIGKFEGVFTFITYGVSMLKEYDVPSFANIDDLKEYEVNGIQLGLASASSLISEIRDHRFDTVDYQTDINKSICFASKSLNTIETYHKKGHIDLVYVFNGRGFSTGPIVMYCQKKGINFKTFEILDIKDKYDLIDNETPHDINFRNNQIEELWNDSVIGREEKQQMAKSFFEANKKGAPITGVNFTSMQEEQQDLGFNRDKEIITFFNSSIDEFAAISSWKDFLFLFEDEVDAIALICEYFKNDDTKQFLLRIHPNLKYLNNTQIKNLKKLEGLPNLFIIKPDDSISSYQLLEYSSKVITFGSTIGIEATYFGIPSISLGLSFYMYQNVVYIPKNKQELYDLIGDRELLAKPRKSTYPYGYWIQSFGVPFKYRGINYPKNLFELKGLNKFVHVFFIVFSRNFLFSFKKSQYRRYLFDKHVLRKK